MNAGIPVNEKPGALDVVQNIERLTEILPAILNH